MKSLRQNLTYVLIILALIFLYFILDRYYFNPDKKGISPVDIKKVIGYIFAPLISLIILISLFERFDDKT